MDIFMREVAPICPSSSVKASWFTSISLSRSFFGLFIDRCIQQTGFRVMHKVVLGAYLIYLHRVKGLPRECVHLQSTCFRISCGDIIEITLSGVWVRCIISSFSQGFWQSSQSHGFCRFGCPHKNKAYLWAGHCGF